MKKLVKPTVCTSVRCAEPPQPHCIDCSHAIYHGRATIAGRIYRWEHSPMFGPLFSRANKKACDWSSNHRHPVWSAFQKWHDRKFGKIN